MARVPRPLVPLQPRALLALASSLLLLLFSQGNAENPRGSRILPYSLYLRRIEERGQHHHPNINGSFHNPFAEPSLFHSSVFGAAKEPPQQQEQLQAETSISGKPVVIYLPAFANATSEHIATNYGVRQRDELGTEEPLFRCVTPFSVGSILLLPFSSSIPNPFCPRQKPLPLRNRKSDSG